jgi:hypothetical protein
LEAESYSDTIVARVQSYHVIINGGFAVSEVEDIFCLANVITVVVREEFNAKDWIGFCKKHPGVAIHLMEVQLLLVEVIVGTEDEDAKVSGTEEVGLAQGKRKRRRRTNMRGTRVRSASAEGQMARITSRFLLSISKRRKGGMRVEAVECGQRHW